jgi:hypothetical protein
MKALTTTKGNFGPFASIEVLEDRYRCDNTDLPFSVVGTGTIVEADTIIWPAPPVPTPVVPAEITMRQARLALLSAGKLSAVQTAIDSMPEPMKTAAGIEWEYSNTVLRHNGFVSQLGPMLGLTSEQIDELFILGSTL